MNLPKIVAPEWWYMGFWTIVFLPCFGVTVYFAVKWAIIAAKKVTG